METLKCPVCKSEVQVENMTAGPRCPNCKHGFTGENYIQAEDHAPKTFLAIALLWFYGFVFAALGIAGLAYLTTAGIDLMGGFMAITAGLLVFIVLMAMAISSITIAIGLKNREAWAHPLACWFMIINMFSPFSPVAIVGFLRLISEDTMRAFSLVDKHESA